MATIESKATSPLGLLKQITEFLIDAANFGSGNQWTLLKPTSGLVADITTVNNEVVLKGIGDGQDSIFVGMKLSGNNILLNGFAGYDDGLTWDEQPGSIGGQSFSLPCLPVVSDTEMNYWLTATTKRFIVVVELSTQYEAAYMGLMKPVAVERQFPYPLVVGGSYVGNGAWTSATAGHSIFTCPAYDSVANDTSLRYRRPDGVWRSVASKNSGFASVPLTAGASLWPTNTDPVRTLTVYDSVLTIENVIMYPFIIHENTPVGMIGQLDGVYWIGNREDLANKDSIVYNNVVYKVFSNVQRRDNDQYFAIEWA